VNEEEPPKDKDDGGDDEEGEDETFQQSSEVQEEDGEEEEEENYQTPPSGNKRPNRKGNAAHATKPKQTSANPGICGVPCPHPLSAVTGLCRVAAHNAGRPAPAAHAAPVAAPAAASATSRAPRAGPARTCSDDGGRKARTNEPCKLPPTKGQTRCCHHRR